MSVIVDDQNPSILYSGDWYNVDNVPNTYNSTLSRCVAGGSGFQFQFEGTAVYVYGTIVANTTNLYANFTVDYGVPQTRRIFNTGSVNGNEVQFYSYGGLNTTQQHLLSVEVLEASNTQPLEVDFIAYDALASAIPSSAASTSLPQPTASQAVIEVDVGSKTPVAAIVGGVVGGVAGLLIIAGFLFWYFWRRRGRGGHAYFYRPANAADMLEHEIKPFDPGAPPTAGLPVFPATPPATTTSAVSASYPAPPGSDVEGSAYTASSAPHFQQRPQSFAVSGGVPVSEAGGSSSSGTGSGPRTYSSPNQTYSKAAEAGLLSIATVPATYHADSGVRFGAGGAGASGADQANPAIHEEGITDVPPEYSES